MVDYEMAFIPCDSDGAVWGHHLDLIICQQMQYNSCFTHYQWEIIHFILMARSIVLIKLCICLLRRSPTGTVSITVRLAASIRDNVCIYICYIDSIIYRIICYINWVSSYMYKLYNWRH